MSEDRHGKFSRETMPASPAAASRPRETALASPFDPPRDRFEEKAELGRGGMGRVFEAHDTALDRPVAIKQSLVDDHEIQARFEREVRITARLQHPGIVPVLDAGRDEAGRPFYVMRKIEGRPLAELVDEARSVRDRLALVPRLLAAVDAVAYAHARGVIHRDIKPWNVLLGPFGETLVIDWGLARTVDDADEAPVRASSNDAEGLTRAGRAFGTPGFMAPEQARGDAVDRSVDVYALGATLYHVLTGKRPFAEVASTRAIEVAAGGAMPDFANVPEEVPPELVAIMTKAMAPTHEARYRDASALAEDLRRFLSGQLVAAHRYTAAQLVMRWLRRHRLAVAIAAVAAILLGVLATISIRRVIDERDRADAALAAQAARADELLVERADAIVTSEPARALALLKQLPPQSPAWLRAQAVAETAQIYGVGWARQLDTKLTDAKVARIVATFDGKQIVVLISDEILIGEPSLRQPLRTLAKLPLGVTKVAAWVENDAALVVLNADDKLVRIDIATGKIQPLDSGPPVQRLLPTTADGVVLVLSGGVVRRVDLGGAAPQVVQCTNGAPVARADRVTGGTICATETELWFQRDGGKSQRLYEGKGAATFQVSILPRVAVVETGEVIEWDLALDPPVIRGRWKVDAIGIGYAGSDIVAFDHGGASWLGSNGSVARDVRSSLYPTLEVAELLLSSGPHGLVFSMPGALHLFQFGRSFSIGGRSEALLSVDHAGPYLVGITISGLVRSWKITEALPRLLGDDTGASPIGINDRMVWFRDTAGELLAARLSDTGQFEAETSFGVGQRICFGPNRDVIVRPTGPGIHTVEVVEHETKQRRHIEGAITTVSCAPDASVVVLIVDNVLRVLDTRISETVSMLSVEGTIEKLAVSGSWIAYLDTTKRLVRVNRDTNKADALQVGPIDHISVESTGRVGFARDGVVSMWSGEAAPRAVIKARTVTGMMPSDAGLIVVADQYTISLVEPNGRVRSYQTGSRTTPSVARVEPFVLITELDQNLAVLDLRDGTLRRIPWWAERATVSHDGRTVLGMFDGYALMQRTTVPRDLAGVRAWVENATNATLVPGSTRLDWPN